MARGRQIADAYIQVHGDLSKFNNDLRKAAVNGRDAGKEHAKQFSEAWGEHAEKDVTRRWDDITKAMYSGKKVDWDRVIGDFDSGNLRTAKRDINAFMEEMRNSGKMTSDQMALARRSVSLAIDNQRRYNQELKGGNLLKRTASRLVDKMRSSWQRMDSTVRLVLTLIAISAGSMATLLSGLASSITAIISSLGMAIAAIIPLGAALAGAALGVALIASSMDELKAATPGLNEAIASVGEAWQTQVDSFATSGFGEALKGLMTEFATTIGSVDFGTPFGEAMAGIADSFTEVLQSPGVQAFMEALTTTIPAAVQGFGQGLAGVLGGLASLLAGAAPHAQALGEQFRAWGTRFSESMEVMRTDGTLDRVFTTARESLDAVMGLVGSLGGALGSLFMLGADSGNRMLEALTGIVDRFTAWMGTDAGRASMLEWFRSGEAIMASMAPLLTGLAEGLGALVTPHTIGQFAALMESVGEFLPILAEMLAVVSELGILNIIVEAFNLLGQAIQPLLPALHDMAGVVGPTLQGALGALAPLLTSIFGLFEPLIRAWTTIASTVGPTLVDAIGRITSALTPILDVIKNVVSAVTGFLAPILGDVLVGIINNVIGVVEGLSQFIMGVVDTVKALFSGEWGQAWEAAKSAVSGAVTAIWNFLQLWIIGRIGSLFRAFGPWLKSVFGAAWTGLRAVVSNVLRGIGQLIGALLRGFGSIISGAGRAIGGAFRAIWNGLASIVRTVFGAIRDVITAAFTAITGIFRSGGQGVGNAFSAIWSNLVNIVRNVFGAIHGVISGILTGVVNVIRGILTTVWQYVQPIVQMWLTGIQLIWTSISTVVSTAVNFVRTIIINVLTAVWTFVQPILAGIVNVFRSAFTAAQTVVSTVFNAIRGVVSSVINAVRGTISSVLTTIQGIFSTVWGAIQGVVTGVINAISGVVSSVMGTIQGVISSIMSAISGNFGGVWRGIQGTITGIINGIRGTISSVMGAISGVVSSMMGTIRGHFSTAWGTIKSTVSTAIGEVRSTIRTGVDNAAAAVRELPGKARDALSNIGSTLREAGRNLLRGFIDGIRSMGRSVADAALAPVRNAASAVRDFLRIGSPSKLFRQYGAWTGEGMQLGLGDGVKGITSAASAMAAAVAAPLSEASMFEKGKIAALGLADGLKAEARAVQAAGSGLTAGLAASVPGVRAISPVRAADRAVEHSTGSTGRSVTVAEGAINIVTPAKNPETVAGIIIDNLALNSRL